MEVATPDAAPAKRLSLQELMRQRSAAIARQASSSTATAERRDVAGGIFGQGVRVVTLPDLPPKAKAAPPVLVQTTLTGLAAPRPAEPTYSAAAQIMLDQQRAIAARAMRMHTGASASEIETAMANRRARPAKGSARGRKRARRALMDDEVDEDDGDGDGEDDDDEDGDSEDDDDADDSYDTEDDEDDEEAYRGMSERSVAFMERIGHIHENVLSDVAKALARATEGMGNLHDAASEHFKTGVDSGPVSEPMEEAIVLLQVRVGVAALWARVPGY